MHKRRTFLALFAVVVSCALLVAMFPVNVLAGWGQTGTTDGWNWTILDDNTLSITGCSGKSGAVTIPDSLDTGEAGPGVLPVTVIGNDAFNGDYASITGIILPGGLRKIGDGAFLGTSISSITIPAGCVSIGGSAFNNTGLTSIAFASPSSLQSIGGAAFLGTGLTSIVIPDSVTSIGDNAFYGCTRLESVTLPHNAGFTRLRGTVFSGCEALHSIDIPASVTAIDGDAFMSSGLESITIPAGVTSIGNGAFGGTSRLSAISVDTHNAAYASQDGVLYNKAKTTLVGFPGGKSGAFTIPEGVEQIVAYAFCNNYNLTEVTIPSSVETIESYAFIYCHSLSKVFIKSDDAAFGADNIFNESLLSTAPDGGIYGIGGSTAQTYANTHKIAPSDPDYIPFHEAYYVVSFNSGHGSEVPDAVVDAGEAMSEPTAPTFDGYDFGGWYTDSSYGTEWDFDDPVTGGMTLHAKWTRDGELYHSGETDNFTWEAIGGELTVTGYTGTLGDTIEIPDSIDTGIAELGTMDVTRIGDEAFCYYYMVTSFTLPSNLISIGESAFAGCFGMESVTIPAGVEDIGDFAFEGCSNLESVDMPASVEDIGDSAFQSCSKLESISIPASVENIGESAFQHCSLLRSVTIAEMSNLESIGASAFSDSGLTSFDMPDSVTGVGAYAFSACYDLQSVTLSEGFSEISSGMFSSCLSLKSITIPAAVESIDSSAFSSSGLETITIPDTVTQIGENVFEGCFSLQSAVLPDNTSFTAIPSSLFYYCVNLHTVNFPAHATAILDNAFSSTGFTDIVIPDTVESIGGGVFSECSSLESIELPDNPAFTRIPNYLLAYCSSLQSVVIPSYVTAIGDDAFASSGLTEFTIPAQIVDIGDWAFASTLLTDITIPANLSSMGRAVFAGCPSLSDIYVDPANTHFASEDGVLYNAGKSVLLAFPGGKSGAFTVPDGVQTIGINAFFACKNLTEVLIPESVALIDDGAFIDCSHLTKAAVKSNEAIFGGSVFTDTALETDGIYGIEDSTAEEYAYDEDIPFYVAYCTVAFDSRGGSSVPGLVVDINGTAARPDDPTRTGHVFGDWHKDENGTQLWNFASDYVLENITLYAKWTARSYTITYNLNSGTNNPSNPASYTYGAGLTLAAPAREGYVFGGWYGEATFQHKITSISGTQTGDVTLWANWLPKTVASSDGSVTLDLSGATLPDGVTGVSLSSGISGEGSADYAAVLGLLGSNQSGLVLYDLRLLDQNGTPITGFTGKIKVRIKIPDGFSGDLHVYWYDPATRTLTDMNATAENGCLVFETSHFSFYAIAKLASPIITGLPATHEMYKGGHVTWNPQPSGGTWNWDKSFFNATFDGSATFTALKTGTSAITYTVNGVTQSVSVTIRATELPQTGQDGTWIWVLCGAGVAVLAVSILLGRKKRLKNE